MSWSLVIHGGAGLIERQSLSEEREALCRQGLLEALEAGSAILRDGGSALDAVQKAVASMEDSPLFNAGRGAVLTSEGTVEFDASIMCGKTRRAGAIAAARTPKNPILAARAVLETDRHVLLVGEGADAFISRMNVEQAAPSYFEVPERKTQLQRMQARDRYALDHDPDETDTYGTVGAVALDCLGDLAAATSTGGMVNQWPGRVGDSALIGAGTWADNQTCAISGTGQGEAFIRGHCAGRVADRVELRGESLDQASHHVIHEELIALGGRGGLIGLDSNGTMVLPFSTGGMFRAWARSDAVPQSAIW